MKVDKTTWEKKNIKTICTDIFDGDWIESKDQSNEGIRLVQTGNIGVGKYRDKIGRAKFISEQTFYELNCSEIYPGDVLVSRLPDPVGRACIVPTLDCRMITAVDCSILRFNKTIYRNKFFIYYTQSNSYSSCVERQSKGTTRKRISRKNLESISCPVPNLEEQDMIIAELDAIQAMIDGYREQLADLDRLAQSIFLDTFGDPISNPKGWEIKSLKELSYSISTGPFGSMLHKSDYSEDGVPCVNPQNIINGKVSSESIAKVKYDKAKELSKYKLVTDDIVVARRGDLSKCAIISEDENGWICGTGSFFIKLKSILPILFYYQYTSSSIQKQLNEKCIGATMPNLNQGILASLNIIIPPLALQQQFAEQVEAIERQKEAIRQQLVDAETLMAERMQYYFS